jgi:hypothetical protein
MVKDRWLYFLLKGGLFALKYFRTVYESRAILCLTKRTTPLRFSVSCEAQ